MSAARDLLEALQLQAENLRQQVARQDSEHRADYAQLETSWAKIERDIAALQRLLDAPMPGQM
ncbi:hypothetical protein EN814_09745 [Mesorhizobium sp. M2D.F.Ca.ET.171.01.1.1]|uniref:hypothetical protein n=1 Tax=unclassified Mesorhizobium TaxID=325217 RepID=UPI0010932453|nr:MULTISPECIES: hypothetical protein [unclassified Mesorhizobium]TGS97466.1 hypothetical protein EN821_09740 [Mesorhizobium sp. M2D.F.Ca.ET.178.01.1.1]TGT12037.1 hypothetical protein EN814_09745 [Mesorhizobium sp. M2D.F.Ca.ET.171.01.1.1]